MGEPLRAQIRSPMHTIESKPLPDRYARGWHCLGLADDYKDGKPHTLDVFGTRLAAFQGEDGEIHVLNAWCPHMGGDLSHGTVSGNSVLCPFHKWSWGADGVCNHIPYAKRIPPKARVKCWPTCEQNKLLFVWNDPENNPPPPELAIPRINAVFSGEWSDWEIITWRINTNCRELIDNQADMAHFGPVHGAPIKYFANIFDGDRVTQIMVGSSERLSGDSTLATRATYFGPAYHITHMIGEMNGMTIESVLLNSHVPVTQNSFDLRFGVIVKKVPGLSDEQNAELAKAYVSASQTAFAEDVAIWDNKVRIDNPLLCDGDGPIYRLRQWYEQFYVNVAEVPQEARAYQVVEVNQGLDIKPPLNHVDI